MRPRYSRSCVCLSRARQEDGGRRWRARARHDVVEGRRPMRLGVVKGGACRTRKSPRAMACLDRPSPAAGVSRSSAVEVKNPVAGWRALSAALARGRKKSSRQGCSMTRAPGVRGELAGAVGAARIDDHDFIDDAGARKSRQPGEQLLFVAGDHAQRQFAAIAHGPLSNAGCQRPSSKC